MKRLVVIDGKSVFYRGYYSMPNLSTKDGTPTGGVYGFAALSLEIIKKLKPDYVAVAWDKPKTNIRRRVELYPGYKAGRKPAPADFYEQIPILHQLLEAFGWPLYECDDYEADDIMGALAIKANEQDIEACLITSDLDMLQLINDKTHVYAMKKGFTNIELYNPESFEEKYGISVGQFLDLKSLKGDSSDNIPGVPGIGEKTALELLKQHESLDGVYEHLDDIKETIRKKLIAGKDSAYLSKEIARIWIDAPIDFSFDAMDVTDLDTQKLADLLTQLEFKSLLKNLPTNMQQVDAADPVSTIEPVEIKPWGSEARVALTMAEHIVVATHGDHVLVSAEETVAYQVPVEDIVDSIAASSIVAHDAKPILKLLLSHGATTLPVVAHDTQIGGFILNSLIREQSLADLSGVSLDSDETGAIAMAALWKLYREQQASFEASKELSYVAHSLDFALIPVLARMEHVGITLDTHFLAGMSLQLSENIQAIQTEMFDMVGYEFNIASPAQLGEVLFGKLQLPTTGIKKGKTGYSTGQKELDKLRGQHPIIELIEQFRELSKLKNTYVDTLPVLIDDQSRLHTNFRQDIAATGRLSSADPNLQNIPIRTEIGRKIRTAFVPADGNVFVSADYSQFELRLAAVLARDTQLINDFNGDLDIHTKTASDTFHVPLESVSKDQRRAAKVINFGVLYGMSPHGLAAAAHMSFGEAKKFIDDYFALRAPIRQYIDDTLKQANDEGYVQTLFGRRRPTPDVRSSNWVVREAAKRAAANMPIQGTEADLMKLAMLKVDERLGDLGVQVLQIHDSILVECPEENAERVGDLLKETMESIYPELGVKLRVDVTIGKNWGEL